MNKKGIICLNRMDILVLINNLLFLYLIIKIVTEMNDSTDNNGDKGFKSFMVLLVFSVIEVIFVIIKYLYDGKWSNHLTLLIAGPATLILGLIMIIVKNKLNL
tara:strand:+ start:387 stop:695 length:309 start_codon:yes stop_codon:yes gene_type:complete